VADIAEPHIRESLGLYVLGALGDESDRVEQHLLGCPACQHDFDELTEAVAALTVLTPEDRRAILAEFGGPVPEPPGPDAPARPPVRAPRPDRRSPGERRGPRRPTWLPARLRQRRTRLLLSIGGLAAVVVLSIGVVLGSTLGGPDGSGPTSVTLAATAADRVSGATLSVSVTGDRSGVTVRATVTGLVEGARYELYAVDRHGRTSVVSTWIGSSGVREVTGSVPVAPDDLSFFTVTQGDGSPVVSAYLHHPSATPS
jgi:Putative zinc-finger